MPLFDTKIDCHSVFSVENDRMDLTKSGTNQRAPSVAQNFHGHESL